MTDSVDRTTLDSAPDESTIVSLRETAKETDTSVEATFPTNEGEQKRLVVSPRGTVVLLNTVSEETFHRSRSAAEIATAVRDASEGE